MNLESIHIEILEVLNTFKSGRWVPTRGISFFMLMETVKRQIKTKASSPWIWEHFGSNVLPKILARMAKHGYVLCRKRHNRSEWTLGPMADELKEKGILGD